MIYQGSYEDVLKGKEKGHMPSGFDVAGDWPWLFPFQQYCTKDALKFGRYCLFEGCGLGKSRQQVTWSWEVVKHTGRPVLILAPLVVCDQTIEEVEEKLNAEHSAGIEIEKLDPLSTALSPKVYIINYEQIDNIRHLIALFAGVVLDESSLLKNFTGKTKRKLLELFENTPFKLCCTATPAPNDYNEIGNHSEFINVLDAQDMRAKWFVRDEGMNNYRLKGHAKADFFAWMRTWCKMFENPADIGFPMQGYNLPEVNYQEVEIKTQKRENGKLYNEGHVNATSFHQEVKLTMLDRLQAVADIVNNSDETFLIWIEQIEEGKLLRKLIPGAVEVQGSDNPEVKSRRLLEFAHGKIRVLICKGEIAGFGMNFQSSHNMIFANPSFSFETIYQCICRQKRFGQTHTVNVWMVITDTMENVIAKYRQKEKQFFDMLREMNEGINGKQYGLLHEYEFKEYRDANMWLMKGDSVIEIDRIEDESLDLIIFSPPFSALFTYSNYIHDMGNNESHEAFFKQYNFLLKKLYRKLKPGRLMCCHTKDLGEYKNSSGYTGIYPFTLHHTMAVLECLVKEEKERLKALELEFAASIQISQRLIQDGIDDEQLNQRIGDITLEMEALRDHIAYYKTRGFKQHCDPITIWTDPVLEMQRTKTQRLLYKTVTSDSTYTGTGMPEYITIFKKWDGSEENWEPVTNLTKQNFPLDIWQKWASPVWMDIKRTDVLNNKEGTAQGDEKHIAPLQLEVIHRLVNLYSNEGEKVFTPFLGIGSEPFVAIRNNRYGIGIELKDSYFEVAVKNCKKAVGKKSQILLFDELPETKQAS